MFPQPYVTCVNCASVYGLQALRAVMAPFGVVPGLLFVVETWKEEVSNEGLVKICREIEPSSKCGSEMFGSSGETLRKELLILSLAWDGEVSARTGTQRN